MSRGELDEARKACRKAAAAMRPLNGDATIIRFVRMAVKAVGLDCPEANELLVAAAGDPPDGLTAAIRQNPKQARGYEERAEWYGRHGLWKKAADDLAEAVRLEPNSLTFGRVGIALVHLGDIDRYRELCRAMLDRWAETRNNVDAAQTARLCLLRADCGGDPNRIAKLVSAALLNADTQPYLEWRLFNKGLHAYRTGKFAEAVATSRQSRQRGATEGPPDSPVLDAANLVVEAMALHRQGDTAAARQSLGLAKRLIDLGFLIVGADDFRWYKWLMTHILYREAEALINDPTNAATR